IHEKALRQIGSGNNVGRLCINAQGWGQDLNVAPEFRISMLIITKAVGQQYSGSWRDPRPPFEWNKSVRKISPVGCCQIPPFNATANVKILCTTKNVGKFRQNELFCKSLQ